MLREVDNIKIGSPIIYIQEINFLHFKLTVNRIYNIKNLTKGKYHGDGYEQDFVKIEIWGDDNEPIQFDVGSILGNCFETLQKQKKQKLKKLTRV